MKSLLSLEDLPDAPMHPLYAALFVSPITEEELLCRDSSCSDDCKFCEPVKPLIESKEYWLP